MLQTLLQQQEIRQFWPCSGLAMPKKARAVRREVISWVLLATSINSSTLGLLVVGGIGEKAMGVGTLGGVPRGGQG